MATIVGTIFSDTLGGTAFNDQKRGLSGNDTFRVSGGNDLILGDSGFDTMDYSNLGRAMTIGPGGSVNKNGLGVDQLDGVERIVGSRGFSNWIDGQGGSGSAFFDVDLATNSLTVNRIPGIGNFTFTAVNFFNVRGTNNSDVLAGNAFSNVLDGAGGNDILIGRGGNDALVGSTGNDILLGTDSRARGNGEIDRLTGGFGADRFVLGDRSGSYYRNGISRDFAIVSDFNSNDRIQLGAGEIYRAVRDSSGFNLFIFRNGGFDLIADVNASFFARLPVGNFRLGSGQAFGNFVGA